MSRIPITFMKHLFWTTRVPDWLIETMKKKWGKTTYMQRCLQRQGWVMVARQRHTKGKKLEEDKEKGGRCLAAEMENRFCKLQLEKERDVCVRVGKWLGCNPVIRSYLGFQRPSLEAVKCENVICLLGSSTRLYTFNCIQLDSDIMESIFCNWCNGYLEISKHVWCRIITVIYNWIAN